MADTAITLAAVKAGEHVLEVGFGPGLGIQRLVEAVGPAGLVTGVDHAQLMVDRASARNAQSVREGMAHLLLADVAHIPVADASVDKVLAIDNAHFWPDPRVALTELRRVLRQGGALVIGFSPMSGGSATAFIREVTGAGFTAPSRFSTRDGDLLVARSW